MKDQTDIQSSPGGDLPFREAVNSCPIDHHFAGCWMVDACDHIEQCRFPAPRFADDRNELTGVDLQVDALKRGKCARGALERFRDPAQIDEGAVRRSLFLRGQHG